MKRSRLTIPDTKWLQGIAWDRMTSTARQEAIRLLRAAPADARLLRWLPQNDERPLAVRERELFMGAATWPDKEIRDNPEFDDWHYINLYWEQRTPDSRPRIRPGSKGQIVKKLNEFERSLRLRQGSDQERGIQLVWMLHLIGDIHQPLHCSARIAPPENRPPEGDLGGNLFRLRRRPAWNLHKHWDNILDISFAGRSKDEIIGIIRRRHPIRGNLQLGQYQRWAIAGRDKAIEVAYPATLVRDQMPSDEYSETVSATVEPLIALGGARLGETLSRILRR